MVQVDDSKFRDVFLPLEITSFENLNRQSKRSGEEMLYLLISKLTPESEMCQDCFPISAKFLESSLASTSSLDA